MPRVRVHQHVNPLSPYYTQEPSPIALGKVFVSPSMPLHIDQIVRNIDGVMGGATRLLYVGVRRGS